MVKTGFLNISERREDGFDIVVNTISKELSNSKHSCQNEDTKEPLWKCRYVVTVIGFLVFLSASIHRTIMGVLIVAMVNNTAIVRTSRNKSVSCPDLIANSTDDAIFQMNGSDGELIWSPETQGYILGCFFFGHIFALVPSGRLAERFGCKWILVGSTLTISILTMLIPPFARQSASAVTVIQALRGFAQGMPGPCITILMANWCPKTERGFLYSIIQTSHSLGPALGNILAGYISESTGRWSYALYTVGGSGVMLAAYIFFYIAEHPKEHPRLSKAELKFILSQQESRLPRRLVFYIHCVYWVPILLDVTGTSVPPFLFCRWDYLAWEHLDL